MMTIPSIDLSLGTVSSDAAGVTPIGVDAQSAVVPDIPMASAAVAAFQQAMAEPIAENAALGEAFAAAVAATVSEETLDLTSRRRTAAPGEAVLVAPPVDAGERDARPCRIATSAPVGAPVASPAEVECSSVAPTKAECLSVAPAVADQPSTLPAKVAQPSDVTVKVEAEKLAVAPDKGDQPSVVLTKTEQPRVLLTKVEQPSVLPSEAEEAGVATAKGGRPIAAPADAAQPIVASPVRNRGEAESAEALVAAGVAPNVAQQPYIVAVPETPIAPSITPAEIVRAQAAVSVVASAAPAAATPAVVLVEAAQAVADTLLVSPGLLRGQGEIVVQLRPDVLEGTEVRIAVTGRQLDVQFRPTTVDMSVLLENGRTQIASHLSAKIATFNVTVDVRKKRV